MSKVVRYSPPVSYSFERALDAGGAQLPLLVGEALSGRVLESSTNPSVDASVVIEGGPELKPPFVWVPTGLLSIVGKDRIKTDTSGRFQFDGLERGEYTLRVVPYEIAPEETFGGLHTGAREHRLQLEAPGFGALVLDATDKLTGDSIPNFTVQAMRLRPKNDDSPPGVVSGWGFEGRSGESVKMAGGLYSVEIGAKGYGPVSLEVLVPSGGQAERTVALTPASSARFLITDEAGRPRSMLHFQLLGQEGVPIRSRVNGAHGTRGVFVTDESGIVVLNNTPPGWCRVLPRSGTDVVGVTNAARLDSAWVWVPDADDPLITCTLIDPGSGEPQERHVRVLVSCKQRFQSGEARSFDLHEALPSIDNLADEMTFQVRVPGGAVYSTSTFERRGESAKLSFESAVTSGVQPFGDDASIALITLLLPASPDQVEIVITSSEQAAVVPFSPPRMTGSPPNIIVLD